MRLFVLTCTGDRPEAFALCRKMLEAQTLSPTEWAVIDDGWEPFNSFESVKLGCNYIRATPMVEHSLDRNLNYYLMIAEHRHCVGNLEHDDLIAFIEDDDYYPSTYLEKMAGYFANDPSLMIVGEERSIYYNLPERRYKILDKRPYAALCQTVIRAPLLPLALEVLHNKSKDNTFDVALWQECCIKQIPRRLIPGEPLVVGIKGMPGRKGIGRGHFAHNVSEWTPDPLMEQLRAAIGDDNDYGNYYALSQRLEKEKNSTADGISGPPRPIQPEQP